MSKNQIVIVTQRFDPHTDSVIQALQEVGHEAIRLNTNDIPLDILMSLRNNSSIGQWGGSIRILLNGRIIDIDAIRSIWWRRPGEFCLPTTFSQQEHEFAKGEIDHALRGLWASLDCYWISYPEYIRQASWKISQLQRASQLGFEVPRTLITTDKEDARAFFDECKGQVIFKVMTDPLLAAPKRYIASHAAYTTLVTESELSLLDSVRLVPCMFQEYIPKYVELRVTIIGDDIFAAEIHSQEHEKTRVDWRHYDVDIPYYKARLPTEVAERCLALVRSYKLNFSAIDLILTPDGRYVFIESNPNGQFIFVEEKVPELRMTQALATCLLRGANS